jgi:hypothetical protein
MANIFFTPAVPAGDGTGAWTSVVAAGTKKTISVEGTFVGTVTIEVTNDGTGYHSLKSFTAPGEFTVDCPCQQMRVRRSGTVSGTPIVTISAEDDGTEVANLPVSAGDGVGAGVNVADYGNTMSILVAATWTGTVTIEISADNTNWSQLKSFTGNAFVVMTFVCKYMRVRRSGNSGGTPNVDVAAGNDADSLVNLFGDGSDGDVRRRLGRRRDTRVEHHPEPRHVLQLAHHGRLRAQLRGLQGVRQGAAGRLGGRFDPPQRQRGCG